MLNGKLIMRIIMLKSGATGFLFSDKSITVVPLLVYGKLWEKPTDKQLDNSKRN